MSDDEEEFRRALKRDVSRPESRAGYYIYAAVCLGVGVVSVIGAKSQAIYYSGFILVGVSFVLAGIGWKKNQRWR